MSTSTTSDSGFAKGVVDRSWIAAIATAVIGAALSVVLFVATRGLHQKALQDEFAGLAEERIAAVKLTVERDLDVLHSVNAFFEASNFVDRDEFRAFTSPLLARQPGIQALEWIPRVTADRRAEFEQSARADGLTDFVITQRSADGTRVKADDRAVYHPVFYLEPLEGNEAALGFDLSSDPARRQALEQAAETGLVVASPRVKLVQQGRERDGVLLFFPRYRRDAPVSTAQERRDNLVGSILGVFRTADFLASAVSLFELANIDIRLEDESAAEDRRVLAVHAPRPDGAAAARAGVEDSSSPLRQAAAFDVGGRTWRVTCSPAPAFFARRRSIMPLSALLIGLLFSLVLAGYVHRIGGEASRVNRLVKERTAELRASEERFELAVSGSSDGLWDWNVLTNEVYYSPRFKTLMGYEDHEIDNVFESWETRLHADDRGPVLDAIRAHIEDRVPYDVEYRLRTKSGIDRWFRARGQAVWNDEGRATRMAGSITDITDRKLAEAQLRKTNQQLEAAREAADAANHAKSEFLASMSHELRTPLIAIIGFTDGLLQRVDKHPLTDHQKNRLSRVKLAGQHLLSLINDVLDIAKVEAGEMRVNATTFDAGDLAGEVGDLTEALVADKPGVTFSLKSDGGVPPVHSDRDKIKQILVNLLSNAVKFTEDGSVTLLVQRDGASVLFSVEDTGVGIPQAEVHKVFDKFHQVGGVHQEGGTGLGLALCRQFADLLGGVLTVRSVEGQGSTFTLSVPAHLDETAPDHTLVIRQIRERARSSESGPGQRVVLCVEDNPNNMLLLQDYLSEAGCHVIPLFDSADAIKVAESESPDLVVLDVMMPGLDGWELLRRLKSNPRTRDVPVILATAIDDEDLGLSLGASDYLTKPIDKSQLLESIDRVGSTPGRDTCEVAVVDDDPSVRDLLGDLLEDEGYRVRVFEDGADFLEALETWKPDALLLDLMMPRVDGFAVVDAMRNNPAWRDIPTLILTAMILSSEQLVDLNKRVQLVIEKNGMSRDRALKQIVDYLEVLPRKGMAA